MNFNGNLVLWICVTLLTKHCLLTEAGECIQRRLGACKVLNFGDTVGEEIYLKDFQSPQPEGFAVKTSIEINFSENKHSFENNLPVERKRSIGYNLDNEVLATIGIRMFDSSIIDIILGEKYYRLAELKYYVDFDELIARKYSSYTPILPTFPYNLHLEMTTNGTFSVYADANMEPFLQYQLDKRPIVESITIYALDGHNDLIAFVDCSEKYKPNCGTHRVDSLYGCREWFLRRNGDGGSISNFVGFQKTYEEGVLFDEFVVVDIAIYFSVIWIEFYDSVLQIVFRDSSIEALLSDSKSWNETIKSVKSVKWTETPGRSYSVRVLVTKGNSEFNLQISDLMPGLYGDALINSKGKLYQCLIWRKNRNTMFIFILSRV